MIVILVVLVAGSCTAWLLLRQKMRPLIIALEGPIAVGKSTMCTRLKRNGFVVYTEGADDPNRWGRALQLFYTHLSRWSFTLQVAILFDMYMQYKHMRNCTSSPVVFVERCPSSALMFANHAFAEGHLNAVEYAIYIRLHRQFNWYPDYIISLELAPQDATTRMRNRARVSELNVSNAYVRRISSLYNHTVARWRASIARGEMPTRRIYTVDASLPPDMVEQHIVRIIRSWSIQRVGVVKKTDPQSPIHR